MTLIESSHSDVYLGGGAKTYVTVLSQRQPRAQRRLGIKKPPRSRKSQK